MKLIAISLGVALSLAIHHHAHGAELTGEVFIVSKAQAAARLALVTVAAYREDEMVKWITERKAEQIEMIKILEPISKLDEIGIYKWLPDSVPGLRPPDQLSGLIEYIASPDWFFSRLPAALEVARTKTDATGKYSFDLPPGNYVLAASTLRELAGGLEDDHWMIRAQTGAKNNLTNDNLSGTRAPESLIITIPLSQNAIRAIKGRNAVGIYQFIREADKARQKAAGK